MNLIVSAVLVPSAKGTSWEKRIREGKKEGSGH